MIHFEAITGRKIKVAVVGIGRVSKNHLDAIAHRPEDLELVAICDAYKPGLDKICAEKNVPGFQCLDKMLAEIEVDVVAVCTPSGLHAPQSIKIANAGKHVITEKPMATRFQDGVDMIKAADLANVRLFVVKQNRLNSTLQLLKNAIDENRFGKIYMMNINVFWRREQSYYDLASWRGTWENDGGVFMNQACHYMDMLHWLLGPVEKVHAMMGTLARKIEAEDTGVINVKWRSGAMGSMSVTNLTYPKDTEGSITVLGEKGTVRIAGIALNKILTWDFEDSRPEDEVAKAASYETDSVYGFGHEPYYENVVDVLRGKAEPHTDGRSALKTLELLIASYRSARDNKEVGLPLLF